MGPNKISACSKSSRKSRGPSALRLVLLPSAVFVGTSLLWPNKAIGSVWSPVNSLLGFHSPLLALYSHLDDAYEKHWESLLSDPEMYADYLAVLNEQENPDAS